MNIEFNVLDRQYTRYKADYLEAIDNVLESGRYILGEQLESFEREFSEWNHVNCCVGLNSGLDALTLAIKSLGIGKGDEIIVPANTYIASVLAITLNGATPIFVEPDEHYNMRPNEIDAAMTNRTRAILAVHLYGRLADILSIAEMAKKNNVYLIEDCAQAHGATINGKMAGTFGDIGCFSFFPTKNLGAFGDGGAIITNDKAIAENVKMLRNYGSREKYVNEIEGVNSRLDELQAALLRVKLKKINELTKERREIAKRYLELIKNPKIHLPDKLLKEEHVYHLFVVRTEQRDDLQEYLYNKKIKTQIHYPIPPHLAECYRPLGYHSGDFPITEYYSKTILSLPLYNGMTNDEISYVINCINEY